MARSKQVYFLIDSSGKQVYHPLSTRRGAVAARRWFPSAKPRIITIPEDQAVAYQEALCRHGKCR
jgi:hypothetical protein